MKKKIIFIITIIFVLVLSLVSLNIYAKGDEITTKTEDINKNENIVFLGDSIFDFFETDLVFSDLPTVNSGISGNKTTDILADLENRVYKYNPTKVFINIGTNDIAKYEGYDYATVDEVADNIIEITKNIQKNRPYCKIYLISIYPVHTEMKFAFGRTNEEIMSINSKIKEYSAVTDGIDYIDAYSQLVDENNQLNPKLTDDGLHPNDLGYAKITEILMKYIYQ